MLRAFLLTLFLGLTGHAVAQDRIHLDDDFLDNRNCWPLEIKGEMKPRIGDGRMFLDKGASGSLKVMLPFRIDPRGDYRITAEFQGLVQKSTHGYGIVWGSNGQSYNCFLISLGNFYGSTYEHGYGKDNKNTKFIDWTKHPSVKPDSLVNEIAVESRNGQLTFYVNGQLVKSMPATPVFGNELGLYSDRTGSVACNRLIVTELRQASLSTQRVASSEPAGEDIHAVAVNRKGHLFVASPAKGLLRSTDQGKRWSVLASGLPKNRQVETVAVDTLDRVVVSYEYYVDPAFIVSRPFYSAQLAFTDKNDGGRYKPFQKITSHVYWSDNNGDTWNALCNSEKQNFYDRLAFKNGRIGGESIVSIPGVTVFADYNDGIYMRRGSEKYAKTSLDEDLITGGELGRGVFGIDLTSKGFMAAGTTVGFYQSNDFGASWKFVAEETMMDIVADPSGVVFAASENGRLSVTIDQGKTWQVSESLRHFVFDLTTGPSGQVYAATSDGLYQTTDKGRSWKKIAVTSEGR